MQQIQVSRGKLSVRRKQKNLLPGELFIDYTNGKKYKSGNQTYELYTYADGEIVKLGGQGVLSFIREIEEDTLPTNPIQGGIYYVTKDIQIGEANNSSSGKNLPEFKKGDLAIYVGEDLNYANPDGDTSGLHNRGDGTYTTAAGWIRVNNGGGTAYEVVFDKENTNYHATNVQEALVEADRNKLAFGGTLFQKEPGSGSNTTHGTATIDTQSTKTGTKYFEITKEALFPSIRAGYYYSVGELVSNTNIHIIDGENTLILEEGDFLVVTSNVLTNSTALTAKDVKLAKMAGGTHDAARINYTVGARNTSYENSTDKAWVDEDANVKNVKEALDVLYQSKADLTDKGKIPLTQLPDTLLNSMEYQGTYICEDGNFTLPTAKDKIHTDEVTEAKKLVQGDYFIYSGQQVNLEALGLTESVASSEGFINSGDWLVYNGEGNKWSVVDNTSPIQSIKVIDNYGADNIDEDIINQTTMTGEVVFKGAERKDADHDGNHISETQLEADDKQTVKIHNVNSALISDNNKADVNVFYKENGAKTLVKTGVSETDEGQLILKEKNGIELEGGVKASKSVISTDADGKAWGDAVAEGDNLKADIIQNPAQSEYGNIQLKLPSQSGTLARLEDTGLTDGKNFYIPRFKKDENDNNIKLVNSPLELIDHLDSGESATIVGFKFHRSSGSTGLQADNKVIFRGSGEVVNIMPKTSGYVLNSNSIIDCGEWTETGIVFENEGNFDSYHNSLMTTESDLYRKSIISHEYLDSGEAAASITE